MESEFFILKVSGLKNVFCYCCYNEKVVMFMMFFTNYKIKKLIFDG